MAPRVSILYKRDVGPELTEKGTTSLPMPEVSEGKQSEIFTTNPSVSDLSAEGPHIFNNRSYHPSHGRPTPNVVASGRQN